MEGKSFILYSCAVQKNISLIRKIESWLLCRTQNGRPCSQAGSRTARKKSGDRYCLGSDCSTPLGAGYPSRETC